MKLFNSKEDSLYLTKIQLTKIFIAFSVMIILLYISAMIASLCGSDYFILVYQNTQLDRIEEFLRENKIITLLKWVFNTIEFSIVLAFILKRIPKWYYILSFYGIAMIIAAIFPQIPLYFYQIYPFAFYLAIPIIQLSFIDKNFTLKKYLFCILRLVIATILTYILQVVIFVIKDGNWSFESQDMSLSANFMYALEYDIALSVILFTMLLVYREKGAVTLWATYHGHGGSSQTSKTQSQKSLQKKNLTKTQRHKIRLLYVKVFLGQIGAFLLLMVLPFVLGKVIEFLVMYLAFAVARYILGFNYSLHYKKESTCITVGVIVFGVLSLAVPFFYVVLIIAIVFGIGLAILLHLSYKYKGMFLFAQIAKPDKFALLYTFFDGDLEKEHVTKICIYKGLNKLQTDMIVDFTQGNKISYIAMKNNYSQRMTIYKLDEAIYKLTHYLCINICTYATAIKVVFYFILVVEQQANHQQFFC